MAIDVTPDLWLDPDAIERGHAFYNERRDFAAEGYEPIVWVPHTGEPAYGYQDAASESNRDVLDEMSEQYPEHVHTFNNQYIFRVDEPEPGVYELPNELAEIVGGLEDYPVLDESRMSEIETRYEDEAWESWGADDWQRELEDIDFEDEALNEVMEEIFGDLTKEQLWEIYRKAAERANVYVEHTHEGPRFQFDRAVDEFKITDLPENSQVEMDVRLQKAVG